MGVGLGVEVGVGVGVAVAMAVGVAVAVAVAVGVAVAVAVAAAVGVAVAVAVAVGVGDGVPHGWYRTTSSTYMPVRSPKASSCTRNFMRTVCPANGVMSTCWLIQVIPFSH